MDEAIEENEALEAVAFVGTTLAPFFLQDPRTGEAEGSFAAMAMLDVEAAVLEWPFADKGEVGRALSLMVDGLAPSCALEECFKADDALMWEYRRLFVGPAPKPAPPWGSVYTDRECVVFGASTLELRSWMRARGVERRSDERTPEDHIGLMLALMAFLACNQPHDLDEYLRFHLLTWAPHFLDELADAADHPFYEGLARLTKTTLEGIRQKRSLEVICPRFYR
ncbi:MAG: Tat proofreading chaperone DmsD [Gordonibacter sp.]|uniref:Tat proofreading chaperone DmsD n=3 Tax=Gordonibacter sp. TaxID=1968902 RepID=UPI002FC7A385